MDEAPRRSLSELADALQSEGRYAEAMEVEGRLLHTHPDRAAVWRRDLAAGHVEDNCPYTGIRRSTGAARNRHSSRPVAASQAYTQPSPEPANTRPSAIVGGIRTAPPVNASHVGWPDAASNARTMPSEPAMNTQEPTAVGAVGVTPAGSAVCQPSLTAAGTTAAVVAVLLLFAR